MANTEDSYLSIKSSAMIEKVAARTSSFRLRHFASTASGILSASRALGMAVIDSEHLIIIVGV